MKKQIITAGFILLIYTLNQVSAQPTWFSGSSQSFQPNKSILFGKDVIINPQPDQDQEGVLVRSAFNGWLYAAYSYISGSDLWPHIMIMRSEDNGSTWNSFHDIVQPFNNSKIRSMDFLVCGDSTTNLKIVIGFIIVSINSTSGRGDGYVLRFSGVTGEYESELRFIPATTAVALAYDYPFPAVNSSPFSIGCLYDTQYANGKDSIVFRGTTNGSNSFNFRKSIAGTEHYVNRVDLAYGRSQTQFHGNYYVIWEEKPVYSSTAGHIYTTRSYPYFNSGFTTPVMIDSLVPSLYNAVRNPSIACQYNNADNDSSDLTMVAVFENFTDPPAQSQILGVVNHKAGTSGTFTSFLPDSSPGDQKTPSVLFNPFDSTFNLTYFNATTQKLPLLKNDMELSLPANWTVVTIGYNEQGNLQDPLPGLALNYGLKQETMAWSATGENDHRVALFDALYLITGLPKAEFPPDPFRISVWPNPCTEALNIYFRTDHDDDPEIRVFNSRGIPVALPMVQEHKLNHYSARLNCRNLINGLYFIKVSDMDNPCHTSFVVLH